MTAIPDQHLRRHTLPEYLAFEETSELKHEFHAGEVLAMSGASPEHSLITANAIAALHAGLAGSPRRIYSSDLKIYSAAADRVCYPDACIICGPIQFHPGDEKRRLVINPRVIIEVLSPTTEAYDRGDKFRDYRTIVSFEEYVLISQTKAMIETFARQADGQWIIAATYAGLDAVAFIRCLSLNVKLSDIYDGVEFPPQAPSPDPRENEPF
jgi:Uma2 family endonuclease